jgi:transporter family-2 protein
VSKQVSHFWGSLIGVAIGVVVAIQSRINGEFAERIGDAIGAAALGFVLGWVFLAVLVLTQQRHRAAVRQLPSQVRGRRIPWWALLGGLGGATLVATQGYAVPALGVALFTVSLVAGQTGSSLEVDRLGLGPSGKLSPERHRIIAAVIALGAVAVAVDPFGTEVALAPGAIAMCLIAGCLVSAQQAFNGRVAAATGSPIAAAFVNFSVGGVLLWSLTLGRQVDLTSAPAPWEEPLLWTGGLLGTVFVITAAWLVRTLGVLLLTLTTIAGQLLGAVVIDIAVPTAGRPVTAWSIAGVLLTFLAVAVGAGALKRRTPSPS